MGSVAIIQARMGSTRLPGKVMKTILGKPMLWHIVRRLKLVQGLDDVVVATSDQTVDEPICSFCRDAGIPCFTGSESDVLDRFYRTAIQFTADPVIRITGDCPFVDPAVVGKLLSLYANKEYDHLGVATGAGALFLDGGRFPDGLDAECFSFAALEKAWQEAVHPLDREHVTPYIWRNKDLFRCGLLKSDQDYSQLRWTVDNEADFKLVSSVYENLYREDTVFLLEDILEFVANHPDISAMNRDFIGKEGYLQVWEVGEDVEADKEVQS